MPQSALPIGPLLSAPRPAFTETEAQGLARTHFGLDGTALPLTSERDQNFRLETPQGSFVLKIANAAEPRGVTECQTLALLHLETVAPALPVPRVIRTLEGTPSTDLPGGNLLRLLTWLEGEPLWRARRGAAQRRAVGLCLGGIAAALADFSHPSADHELLWDIRHAARLRALLPAIPDARTAVLAEQVLDRFETAVSSRLADLPWQVVHNDMNPHNSPRLRSGRGGLLSGGSGRSGGNARRSGGGLSRGKPAPARRGGTAARPRRGAHGDDHRHRLGARGPAAGQCTLHPAQPARLGRGPRGADGACARRGHCDAPARNGGRVSARSLPPRGARP
ncbi:phosphotransferase [Cereibacter sphaeroides f. sp. denitrificans]